ncbi:MAG: DNA recombination/repair protein RecA, partial [Anaerostipes sp.]|nr:DNA recombination/repair protein RecA [Anaerostipes sp.]
IGQGRENAKKYLEEHPEIADVVEHGIRVHYGLIEEEPQTETEEKAEQ